MLSRKSNYIVDVVIWPKFGNSTISIREVIIIWILWGLDQKNYFFEGLLWFKFNDLALALSMASKIRISI